MTAAAIEVEHVSKRYGPVLAVDDLSFVVAPGRVTGFLGPNGAGKTTTLRILLGLVTASAGRAVIGGRRYRDVKQPMREVGASLEATSFHPARSARAHLRILARASGIALDRADTVLDLVGLTDAADRHVGGYSLGMRQRLGLAGALLGDPGVLLLDEPINGLDPEGIRWVRGLLAALAAEGRTVLVSSHVLSEVEQVVDELIVIARGRSVYQGALTGLTNGSQTVLVAADDPQRLDAALAAHVADRLPDGSLRIAGLTSAEVGRAAFAAGIPLTRLRPETRNLEQIFLDLVDGSAPQPASPAPPPVAEQAVPLPPPNSEERQ